MPFALHHTIRPATDFWVWKIEESEEEIRKGLPMTQSLENRLAQRTQEKHRIEVFAVQQLLQKAELDPESLYHDAQGIPRLPQQHISITHAKGYAGIVVGSLPNGVDIEAHREQVQKIRSKFVHSSESFAASTAELIQLWTAKEAVYKAAEVPGLQLNKQLLIAPFEEATAKVEHPAKEKTYTLHFFDLEQHQATVAIENP